MTNWNEDNFLENLMPYWQRGRNLERQSCPNSASLSAFVANELGAPERDTITEHLGRCSECAALHDRLVRFSKPTVTVGDLEWKNAEKRLGDWMGDFLRSREGVSDKRSQHEPAVVSHRFEGSWKWFFSWRTQWALGAATGLAVVAGVILLLRLGPMSHRDQVEIAVQTNSPSVMQSPSMQPGSLPAEKQKESPAGNTAVTAEEKKRTPMSSGTTAHVPPAQPMTPARQPEQSGAVQEERHEQPQNAHNVPAGLSPNVQSGDTQSVDSSVARSSPADGGVTEQPLVGIASDRRVSLAQGNPLPARPSTGGGSHRTTGGFVSGSFAATTGLPSPMPLFQIKGDTRIWIQRTSTIPKTDGTFPIRGKLQQPIKQAGTILLPQGIEVSGFETVSQGQTAQIILNQFTVDGTVYALVKSVSTEVSAPTPGTGRIVPFEGGRVLEMFYDTNSVYQHTADGPSR